MKQYKDISFHSETKDVPLTRMKVSTAAQRELRQHRVDYLHANFDPEMFGMPVLSFREGYYWIIDGQHRIEAAKIYLGAEWEKQFITCRVYSGMAVRDEAAMFRKLQDHLAVAAFDKFTVAVTAEEVEAVAVKGAVERAGLKVSRDRDEGSVSAVSILLKIHKRSDVATVERVLKMAHQSFGSPGLVTPVLDGIARVCERYDGALNDKAAIATLRDKRGGVGALLTKAAGYRKQTGSQAAFCFGAAVVDALNAGRPNNKKLPNWWKE